MYNIENLLSQISDINKKYVVINEKTGKNFNIFDITSISSNEVIICKILYELINPNGSHGQKDKYLKLFLKEVLNITEQDYKFVKVSKEYLIKNNRRIDLYVETDNYKIPIEVKIYAGDQNKQCYDYYKYAYNSKLFYLTLDGNMPSAESMDGLDLSCVIPVSFKYDIINWLNSCLMDLETIKITPIREILFQLKDNINKLTGQVEGDLKMDIVDTIMKSNDNIKSAFDIAEVLPEVKIKITTDFFRELKKLFEENDYIIFDYDEEQIKKYYKKSKLEYLYITLEITQIFENLSIVLCITIDYCLHYTIGFSKLDKINKTSGNYLLLKDVEIQHGKEYKCLEDAMKNVIGDIRILENFYWEYILDNKNQEYDFKTFTSSCIELVDKYIKEAKRIYDKLNGYIANISKLMKTDKEE